MYILNKIECRRQRFFSSHVLGVLRFFVNVTSAFKCFAGSSPERCRESLCCFVYVIPQVVTEAFARLKTYTSSLLSF